CSGGLAFASPGAMDPTACSIEVLSGDPTDCRPLASGAAFINIGNLFAARDNFRQYVVDASQIVRVLSATDASSLQAQLGPSSIAIDASRLGYIGQSLGGLVGSLFLAVAPEPPVGVLNVTAGHILQIVAGGSLSSLLTPLLAAFNVQPDTAGFFQLANTAT